MNPKFSVLDEEDIPSTPPEPSENPELDSISDNQRVVKKFKRFMNKLPKSLELGEYLPDHILDDIHVHDYQLLLKLFMASSRIT